MHCFLPFTLFGVLLIWAPSSYGQYHGLNGGNDAVFCNYTSRNCREVDEGTWYDLILYPDDFLLFRFDIFSDGDHNLFNYNVSIIAAELKIITYGVDPVYKIYDVQKAWENDAVMYNFVQSNISSLASNNVTEKVLRIQHNSTENNGWLIKNTGSLDFSLLVGLKIEWYCESDQNCYSCILYCPDLGPPTTAQPTTSGPTTANPSASPPVTATPSFEPTTSTPSLPFVPQCDWQKDVCLCEGETYYCEGELSGTIILLANEMIWKTPMTTSNSSVTIFKENSSIILEKCHNITGEMLVDYVPNTESTTTLVQSKDDECDLGIIRVSFLKNSECISGNSQVKDGKLVAVFSNTCKMKVPLLPIIATVVIIGSALLICAFIMLYKPARSKVFPFHMTKTKVGEEMNYITTVHSVSSPKK